MELHLHHSVTYRKCINIYYFRTWLILYPVFSFLIPSSLYLSPSLLTPRMRCILNNALVPSLEAVCTLYFCLGRLTVIQIPLINQWIITCVIRNNWYEFWIINSIIIIWYTEPLTITIVSSPRLLESWTKTLILFPPPVLFQWHDPVLSILHRPLIWIIIHFHCLFLQYVCTKYCSNFLMATWSLIWFRLLQ